jgi:monoamine oxidase
VGTTNDTVDVIVIGAGAAGLGAAAMLKDAGKKIVVVEARDRIGGRLWTDYNAMSIPIELGAQVIQGSNASTWELVWQDNLETYAQRNTFTRTCVGCPWMKQKIEDPHSFQVLGGYNQILTPLTRGLPIHLSTIVQRVEHTPGSVTVYAKHEACEIIYSARSVIITLPVAILNANTVEFSPPLPKEKLDAFKAVPHLAVTKVIMEFDRIVFPQGADQVIEAEQQMILMNAAMGDPRYSGRIILASAERTEAERLLAMPRELRHHEILEVVRGIAGDRTLKPIKIMDHEWENDLFARAAYPDSEEVSDVQTIYKPIDDTLFWAGIFTDQVDLSYESGKRTAAELLDRV